MRIKLEPPASDELAEAAAYLAKDSLQAAESFMTEFTAAAQLLMQYPRIGAVLDDDVRRLLLRKFPHQLIFRVLADEIRIYAVAHLKRRPNYWTSRL
jgi:plasmid stabilization system protein ParE